MFLTLLATAPMVRAEAGPDQSVDFQQVYQIIKTNVPGVSDAELNRAAVRGLISALGSRVALVTNTNRSVPSTPAARLTKARVFEDNIGYLRIVRVADDLAGLVSDAYQELRATNRLGGLVLDLRYAEGTDYAAAASTADLFLAKTQPLLDWGTGMVSSQDKTNAIQLPVAILVNHDTSGAAEALAAVLRTTSAGLILGTRTAGQAMTMRDFPLSNGERLRIGTAPVTLGNGTAMTASGVKPDIDVALNAGAERTYYADAFYVAPATNPPAGPGDQVASQGTNGSRRVVLNEAELVREHREGTGREEGDMPRARPPDQDTPVVTDPALARALDLLKGLAVVRQSRS